MDSKENLDSKVSEFWKFLEDDKLEEAEEIVESLLRENAEEPVTHYVNGHLYFARNEFEKAVNSFKVSLSKSDKEKFLSFVNYWIGEVYNHKTVHFFSDTENELYDTSIAEEYFLKSVSYNEFPHSVVNSLSSYFRNNPEESLKILSSSIVKYPKEQLFYLKLSSIYKHHFKDSEKYIYTLSKAVKECGESSELKIMIGQHHYLNKNYQTAIKFYEESKLISNDKEEGFFVDFKIGNIYIELKDFENALDFLDSAINSHIVSINFQALILFTYCLFKLNKTQKAINLIENIDVNELEYASLDEEAFDLSTYGYVEFSPQFSRKEYLKYLVEASDLTKPRLKAKVDYISAVIYKEAENYLKQARSLLNCIAILNYNYLHEEISTAIYYYSTSSKGKEKSILELLDKIAFRKEIRAKFSKYYFESLIEHFHDRRNFHFVCKIFEQLPNEEISSSTTFNTAFAYAEIGADEKAKIQYEAYLQNFDDSSAVLNNLANIYKGNGNTSKAIELYSRALKLDPEDELVINNLKNTENLKSNEDRNRIEKNQRILKYKSAVSTLVKENKYVLEKLHHLVLNLKSEGEIIDNEVAIPKFKFAILMQTSVEKAESLKVRFLKKSYIANTGVRGDYNVIIYEINPFLEQEIEKRLEELDQVVEPQWIKGFEEITSEKMVDMKYFKNLKKIRRINKKYSKYIERDFKELTFNYLVGNSKSTVMLSGSLVEFLLMYYCEKKKLNTITFTNPRSMRQTSKALYDSTLFELLIYADENKLFGKDFPYLGNLLRVYRNLIHPGLELKNEIGEIDKSKLEISYMGANEILNKVI